MKRTIISRKKKIIAEENKGENIEGERNRDKGSGKTRLRKNREIGIRESSENQGLKRKD